MSSTNHTTNYNLPQFLGSDKPAWLGDINPAFSAIDTAMHANATKAQQGVDDASSAQSTANTAVLNAGTAQTTAETAQRTANTVAGDLNSFMLKFNLTNISNGNLDYTTTTGNVTNDLSCAQNIEGSIYKVYGTFQLLVNSSASRTPIAGMGNFRGIDTGIRLITAPSEAYIVKCAGIEMGMNGSGTQVYYIKGADLAVDTSGKVFIAPWETTAGYATDGSTIARFFIHPCVLFNTSFGDTPSPNA